MRCAGSLSGLGWSHGRLASRLAPPLPLLREADPAGPVGPVSGRPAGPRPLSEREAAPDPRCGDRAVSRHSRQVCRGGGAGSPPQGGAAEVIGVAPAVLGNAHQTHALIPRSTPRPLAARARAFPARWARVVMADP